MNRNCTRTVIMLLFLGLSVIAKAQFKTELYLTDLPDEALQEKVQQNISKLLTAMNNADAAQTSLD